MNELFTIDVVDDLVIYFVGMFIKRFRLKDGIWRI